MNVITTVPLHRKVIASQILTRSVSMRPIVKHRKVLTTGLQIKTHLRCDHLEHGPVWGAGNSNVVEVDDAVRRENYRKRCIDRKIDEICDRAAKKGGCELLSHEAPSAVPAKHVKVRADGEQLKTHLRCNHARKGYLQSQEQQDKNGKVRRDDQPTRPIIRKSPRFQSNNVEEIASYDVPNKRKRVQLKSNIRHQRTPPTPRTIYGAVDDDFSDEVSIIDVNADSDGITSVDSPTHHPSLLSGKGGFQGLAAVRDYTRKSVHFPDEDSFDCNYCKEYGVYPNSDACKFCSADHKVQSEQYDKCGGCTDNKRRRYEDFNSVSDEPCPLCEKAKTTTESDITNFRRHYQSMCQFCGKIFQVSDSGITCQDCQYNRIRNDHESLNRNHRAGTRRAQHSHTGWDDSAGSANVGGQRSATSRRGRRSSDRLCKACYNGDSQQPLLPRQTPVNNHAKRLPQARVGMGAHRAGNALDHTCVHQFHQTPRLFVEPSFPDHQGRSTCLLCGAADEEEHDNSSDSRDMTNSVSSGNSRLGGRASFDDNASRRNSIRREETVRSVAGSRVRNAAAATTFSGKNSSGAAAGRDSISTGHRVTIRSRSYDRRDSSADSNSGTRRVSQTTTASGRPIDHYARSARDGTDRGHKLDQSTKLGMDLGSESRDGYRRRSGRLNPRSNTVTSPPVETSDVSTAVGDDRAGRTMTNPPGNHLLSTRDTDDSDHRERDSGPTSGILRNSGKPVGCVSSTSALPRKRYVLSSVNTTGYDRASFVENRFSAFSGRSSYKENNVHHGNIRAAAARVKRDPKNSMALADHL